MKGIKYKTSFMKERRDNVYARLIKKCAVIEDLFYSCRNITAVQEKMCQFNDQLKLLMPLHEEIHAILEVEEEKIESDKQIEMMNEQIFNLKRTVHTWLRNAEEDRISLQSNKSHSSRGSSVKRRSSSKSNVSKRSSCSNKSDYSKIRAVEEKAKLVELLAEESFLIKQQMAQNEAEKLKVQQEIAKAKARFRVFETSAIERRGFKIEQYSIEALLIIGNSKHGRLTMNMRCSSIKARKKHNWHSE